MCKRDNSLNCNIFPHYFLYQHILPLLWNKLEKTEKLYSMTKDEVFFLFLFCFSFLEINLICVHWGYTNTQACLAICCTLQNYTLLCQLCFFSGSFHWICGTTLRILVENSSKRKKKSQLTVDPVTKSTTLKSWRVF